MEVGNIIKSTIERNTQLFMDFAPTLISAIAVLFATYYLGKAFSAIVAKILKKYRSSKPYAPLFLKISKIIFAFIALILFLNILGFKELSTGVFASGGVVTIILGFALREIGENFCAGFLLSINKPFRIGDTIKSGNVEGKVKSIEIRYTHIRSIDGKDIYVPSSQIYKNILINYTKDGLQRFNFTVGIDYSSNLKQACEVIDKEIATVQGVLSDPVPGCVVKDLLPNYIEIAVYFWIDTEDKYTTKQVRQDAIEKIKDSLIAKKIILSNNITSNHNVTIYNEST